MTFVSAAAPSDVRGVPQPFDPYGSLPSGTTVLEASAGTGKTFTIAALVTRFVAEDEAPLDKMLIVTFSRAATGELRVRVRERLTSAERGLADPVAARAAVDDPLLQLLASAPDAEVTARRGRLTHALATFDSATIATTHQFCAQVLAGLGVGADLADLVGGDRFVESLDDLVVEVAEDLYLRKFAGAQVADDAPVIPPAEALKIAADAAVREPLARLEPASAPADTHAGVRRALAQAVRQEMSRRKRIRGVRSYDDLQTDLAAVLAADEAARDRLRERFPVVLIDEFQDTDPVQWQIVSRAFVGHGRLVLIGDPKQAIYGFRGADVTAYLKAVEAADTVATLPSNWRSEQRLLDGFDAIFAECTFGNPRIGYRLVHAAREESRLRDAPDASPIRLRLLARDHDEPLAGKGQLRVDAPRIRVACDVAAEVVTLLSSPAKILDARPFQAPDWRAIEPGDIAVLVRTNSQAALVRDRLRERAVPAVIGGSSSVFTAPVAREWLIFLEALEQPHRSGRVRAAAMTCFLAWSAERLAMASPDDTDALAGLVRGWATVLATRGVAALQETVTASQGLPARLLTEPDGERRLTDLRHIGETLHAAASSQSFGITAMVAWLRRRIDEADEATDGVDERSRRLDSDADAVQVVTIHRSKGLEFPVVFVPFAWDQFVPVTERPRYHDDAGQRVLDVGGGLGGADPAAFNDGIYRHQCEEAGEQLRLFYVAVTRARSQAVLWWAPATTAECAPLSRLLFGRGPGSEGGEPALSVKVPSDADAQRLMGELAARAPGRVSIESVTEPPPGSWQASSYPPDALSAAPFDRELDTWWRRTSYSGLTAAAHDAGAGLAPDLPSVGSEPEEGVLDDEPTEEPALTLGPGDPGDPDAVTSPMAHLPGGTSFGSLVHGVLETVDTEAGDLAGEISVRISEQMMRWGPAGGRSPAIDQAELAAAVVAVYHTPLGSLAGNRRLRDIARSDRLSELSFELPLSGGDQPGSRLTLGELGPLLRRHLGRRQPQDPLAAYSDRLADPLLRKQPLRGFLTGSLDAVLRVGEPGSARYVVVDYKTNWLSTAPAGSGQLTAADYTPDRLAAAMLSSDYPLQALLYSVALHRFLRWRQPGYVPGDHLGGVLYLYLRGMCGEATPIVDGQPCGVFAWKPPAELIVDLSNALDSGQVSR